MSETWRVIDEAGAVHEVEAGQVRGSAAWCARVRSYEAPVIHSDPRGVLGEHVTGWMLMCGLIVLVGTALSSGLVKLRQP